MRLQPIARNASCCLMRSCLFMQVPPVVSADRRSALYHLAGEKTWHHVPFDEMTVETGATSRAAGDHGLRRAAMHACYQGARQIGG